ncbi:MAG TPA: glycosyltransferase family 4 protein [Syntrophorhabdaceae bacterium]|nr:glycosyltransferase family 4 protein [Syntrophorhabdaceae bacterium]
MKILQLLSDWKWTGPAEPVVSLCEALKDEGADVTIAYRKTPIDFPERTVEKEVKKRGIKYHEGLKLNRYFSIKDWLTDIKAIKEYVSDTGVDIVHTNLSHDHTIAVISLMFGKKRPIIVRTDHKRDGMPQNTLMRQLMEKTDGLVTYSKKIMERDVGYFQIPVEKTCIIPPGIKIYSGPVKDLRDKWGIGPEEKVIGVIGRLKPDRGYDVILKAFKIIRSNIEHVKLVIMGRSSQIEKSIKEPLIKLGIEQDVILAGYIIEDYFSAISTFDVFVMMRAGSDGTARALREVMSMAVPAVVSDSGMLPELVKDGVDGYVVLDEYELSEKVIMILKNDELRHNLGAMAKQKAIDEWDYKKQAKRLLDFYERLLRKKDKKER